jgi:hypothetical protein
LTNHLHASFELPRRMNWRMKKMLKKIGLPAIALLGLLAMAPHQANAAVRFGVVVGAPAYAYPAYPVCPPAPVAVVRAPVIVDRAWVRHDLRWDHRVDRRFRR